MPSPPFVRAIAPLLRRVAFVPSPPQPIIKNPIALPIADAANLWITHSANPTSPSSSASFVCHVRGGAFSLHKWYIFMPYIFEGRMETAKVFWSGRSQAVRLPKAFRFETEEVRIRRHGLAVILEPIATDWAWLDALVGPLDDDFARAVNERSEEQERPSLDFFG